MKPRSQSLGSLSVNSPSSSARYEPITNIPMRMAASYEANNNQGFLHDSSDFEKDYALKFVPSKLRRSMSHGSIYLRNPFKEQDEDEELGELNANTNKALNNNHIYADLDLKEEREFNQEKIATKDQKEIINTCDSPNGDKEEIQICKKEVVIEINRVDDNTEVETANEVGVKEINETKTETTPSEIPEVMQNSIDAHLDKIDELNRTLDNRLKRNISPQITDLDAIESAEIVDCLQRAIGLNENANKRFSTSSSDKEVQVNTSNQNDKNKKRSLSFSQKSINAILCNIKEFSKSPLSKMHITNSQDKDPCATETSSDINCFSSHTSKQNSENKLSELANHTPTTATKPQTATPTSTPIGEFNTNVTPTQTQTPSPPPISLTNESDNTKTTTAINAQQKLHSLENSCNHSTANLNPSKDTHIITSKLGKFKVPKIQKKSKAIRQTFRSKFLHFQLRKGKLCKTCTKRRRIHPSKSVFDFSKEFHLNSTASDLTNEDNEEFCTCPLDHPSYPPSSNNKRINISSNCFDDEDDDETSDDVLSMKDHCYCVPSLAMSVSNSNNFTKKGSYNFPLFSYLAITLSHNFFLMNFYFRIS